jgi:hypothetical protein
VGAEDLVRRAEDLTPAVAAMPVAGIINRGFGMFLGSL